MNALDIAVAALPLYQGTYSEDAYLIVANLEQVVSVLPGKQLDLHIEPGLSLFEPKMAGTVTAKCLRAGQRVQEERGAETFGISYIATADPIYEDGKMVGILTSVMSNERYQHLRDNAGELAAMVEQMTATTDEVSKASLHIAESIQVSSSLAEQMTSNVEKIESIATFVEEIASQSNLLGLNAAIEATRAGEQGRGFAVVADHIRKMADQSKVSATEIRDQVSNIQKLIANMNQSVSEVAADSQEHAASVQELQAVFEQVAVTADNLLNLSRVSENSADA